MQKKICRSKEAITDGKTIIHYNISLTYKPYIICRGGLLPALLAGPRRKAFSPVASTLQNIIPPPCEIGTKPIDNLQIAWK